MVQWKKKWLTGRRWESRIPLRQVSCSERLKVVNLCKFTAYTSGQITKFHRISPQNYVKNLLWKKNNLSRFILYIFPIFPREAPKIGDTHVFGNYFYSEMFSWLDIIVANLCSAKIIVDNLISVKWRTASRVKLLFVKKSGTQKLDGISL